MKIETYNSIVKDLKRIERVVEVLLDGGHRVKLTLTVPADNMGNAVGNMEKDGKSEKGRLYFEVADIKGIIIP